MSEWFPAVAPVSPCMLLWVFFCSLLLAVVVPGGNQSKERALDLFALFGFWTPRAEYVLDEAIVGPAEVTTPWKFRKMSENSGKQQTEGLHFDPDRGRQCQSFGCCWFGSDWTRQVRGARLSFFVLPSRGNQCCHGSVPRSFHFEASSWTSAKWTRNH